ncbi:MAG TPA: hypothetical protein VKA94_14755 [Hyphomicrobiales bacterium]|nr:hypothetical protein [Hyphomicrobiales bacterium]
MGTGLAISKQLFDQDRRAWGNRIKAGDWRVDEVFQEAIADSNDE